MTPEPDPTVEPDKDDETIAWPEPQPDPGDRPPEPTGEEDLGADGQPLDAEGDR